MLHVYGETSRTISFRKEGAGYRWIGEQEIHLGPGWEQSYEGAFREKIVVEFQTERVNGIPTNELSIRYTGNNSNLLGRRLTLSEVEPILAQWKTAAVEPMPHPLAQEDFDPSLWMFVLLMLGATLFVFLLLLLVIALLLVVSGMLVVVGIVSVSVATGVIRKSISTGFKVFFVVSGGIIGLLSGLLSAWLLVLFVHNDWKTSSVSLVGAFGGAVAGVTLAWLFNKVWNKVADRLTEKLRRRKTIKSGVA
jgi:hypothetical protein